MSKRITRSSASLKLRLLWCSALVALSSWSHGQTEADEPRWYQVEVIIFERLSNGQAADPETWPKDIALAYPPNWQKLITPEKAAELTPMLHSESSAANDDVDYDMAARGEKPPVFNATGNPEFAFVYLPTPARTLNESKNAIERNRIMRVLFHEAWRQPIVAAENASAIIIQGGNTYDSHHELEGTISLSISRYLHLHTNLWLSQFIPNYGQESGHWPALPAIPERQEQLLDVDASSPDFTEKTSVWDLNVTPYEDYTSVIEEPFLVNRIFTLKQSRRMRSGELHYVDHPHFGLLIKIENYTPESGD